VEPEFVVGLVAFVVVALSSLVRANLRVAKVVPEKKYFHHLLLFKKIVFG